jgi:hypothetical protein
LPVDKVFSGAGLRICVTKPGALKVAYIDSDIRALMKNYSEIMFVQTALTQACWRH